MERRRRGKRILKNEVGDSDGKIEKIKAVKEEKNCCGRGYRDKEEKSGREGNYKEKRSRKNKNTNKIKCEKEV